jgi:FKBP-type peptidyl-prolyl cis-trans isomerase FkpA
MKAGGIRRLYIPSALGYGTAGNQGVIPANANLVFDVTMLSAS